MNRNLAPAALTDQFSSNRRAIVLMLAAIFCFSVMDATVKALSPQIGVLTPLWMRYAGQMAVVLILVAPRLRSVARTRHPFLQFARSILLMLATAFFFLALSRIPLANAASLMATNPIFITLGAALFLGEALGPRRMFGIMMAMLGALLILRPGADAFSLDAIYPLIAAMCYSGYALVTRKVGHDEDSWTSLLYTGVVGTIILSLAIPFHWQPPDISAIPLIIVLVLGGTVGQLFLIRAFTLGEAAMLAPFSYVGLIFAMLWGTLFFAEIPGWTTLAGALVIAGAGLYVWHRETLRSIPKA